MRGVTIVYNGTRVHTGNNLGLVQEKKEIGSPEVQSYKVSVPGRDGLLVLTKALSGRVNYNNRTITLQYFASGSRSQLQTLEDQLNAYHGQVIQVIDDDTPSQYYEGEATVSVKRGTTYSQIVIKIDAYPFRRATTAKTSSTSLTTTNKTVTLINNGTIPVAPVFTSTGSVTITRGSVTKTITTAQTWTDTDFLLSPGSNAFTVKGSGTFKTEFTEAWI